MDALSSGVNVSSSSCVAILAFASHSITPHDLLKMYLSPLTTLLALPTAILSFVIYPEAAVFAQPEFEIPSTRLPSTPDQHVLDAGPNVKCAQKHSDKPDDTPLPVVIWHGLGDSADTDGMKGIAELVTDVHPGTYVNIISLGDKAGSADRSASFFGNVTEQIEHVCGLFAADNILSSAPAIDAIGFSQGGQFMRGYMERCGHWAPKIRTLMTFGSQHNGIAQFQKCKSATDFICQGANAILRGSTVWSDFVQSRLVPAQYFRDTDDYENYLEHSNFLADINNERKIKNGTYARNLAQLEKLVMVVFKDDKTVIPPESGWFSEVNVTEEDGKQTRNVTKLRDRKIYKEDWIGLKQLDEKDALVFVKVEGEHMQLSDKDLKRLFGMYFGPEGRTFEEAWKAEL